MEGADESTELWRHPQLTILSLPSYICKHLPSSPSDDYAERLSGIDIMRDIVERIFIMS